ncbi:LCP family protein [Streptomyces spectabilis]|uniref:LCP family protein required for cell wall assembly n=1 Tax=Streptomyces spectabilis TaxID=68270 RepID=A0A5P2XAS7_STRST|nr:LCP family protein [Streptomyces spectabilis]MBB5107711.1 LCP family protein required for cell wall assembly [Streptomyces spectabilis]MCI3903150.1 LCP family protein [Streptomyces spectabilis]QEV60389.1 LytR family transcriptional regulator [Streptomyces spectabilis]GGV38196.1 transcriptional regulator [Streptomyces spectabilis]
MSDWPDARNGNNGDRHGYGSGSAQPDGARVMRHVQRPDGVPRQTSYDDDVYDDLYRDQRAQPGQQHAQGPGGPGGYDSGYNTGQVYGSPAGRGQAPGGPQGPPGPQAPPRPKPPVNWKKRITWGLVTFLALLIVVSVSTYFWADSKLKREVDLSKVIERPAGGKGTNYLIVGSDSRAGMSDEEKKKLHTGSAAGKRTDSMMILHVADDGGNTMISLPRDSNVTIPSFKGAESGKLYPATGRQTKLNAAYAEDGPELLVRTVEANTGLRIDHYAEIGFGGFAKIVDSVGGVEMDIPKAFKDKWSGADFKAGKQKLSGQEALAFVRTRHAFGSDLERTKNQQKFLSALAHQVATPGTVMNPFKLYPTMGAGLDTLVVDKDMGLFDVASMFWAMKGVTGGDGKSMNMPISGTVGSNLVWDKAKVKQLVEQLNNDEEVTVSGN